MTRIWKVAVDTEAFAQIVGSLRQAWSTEEILLRADSGFARDELMSWCEENGVDYLFGLVKTPG